MVMGPIMCSIEGTKVSTAEQKMLQNPLIGGVILFTRNYQNLVQLEQLIYQLRQIRTGAFLISVDHEGGRIQRFQEGFTALPAAGQLGQSYDKESKQGLDTAIAAGWLMAAELLSLGIDMSFAPVLDIDYGHSEVIGNRSFHRNPEKLTDIAQAYILGMRKAGMAATGKHFPGHGFVKADSHLEIPYDDRDPEEIIATDIIPFYKLHAELGAVMTAHVIFRQLDLKPVTYSNFWLQNLLREQMGFSGAVISDDLSMIGATTIADPAKRVSTALDAGCDMVLFCNDTENLLKVLNNLSFTISSASQQRLLKLCGRFQYTRSELTSLPEYQGAVSLMHDLLAA